MRFSKMTHFVMKQLKELSGGGWSACASYHVQKVKLQGHVYACTEYAT